MYVNSTLAKKKKNIEVPKYFIVFLYNFTDCSTIHVRIMGIPFLLLAYIFDQFKAIHNTAK